MIEEGGMKSGMSTRRNEETCGASTGIETKIRTRKGIINNKRPTP
jgi:hypothetical protein